LRRSIGFQPVRSAVSCLPSGSLQAGCPRAAQPWWLCSRSAGRTARAVILREKGRAGAHRSLDAC